MICPIDQQPCTMDHSQSCYDACESAMKLARELPPVPKKSDRLPRDPELGFLILATLALVCVVALQVIDALGG